MKKQFLIILLPFSFNSFSQRMDPIIMNSSTINVIGGTSIIFNTSPSIVGQESFGSVLGLNELSKTDNEIIYPNPSSDFINLKEISDVNLYDQTGKLIEKHTTKKVDVSSYNSGIYFVSINNSTPIKFIKL